MSRYGLWPHESSSVSRAQVALEHALESVIDAQTHLDEERRRIGLPPVPRAFFLAHEIDDLVNQRVAQKAAAEAPKSSREREDFEQTIPNLCRRIGKLIAAFSARECTHYSSTQAMLPPDLNQL